MSRTIMESLPINGRSGAFALWFTNHCPTRQLSHHVAKGSLQRWRALQGGPRMGERRMARYHDAQQKMSLLNIAHVQRK